MFPVVPSQGTYVYIGGVWTDRSNALQHVQSLSADLFFLHTRAGRLESVSSRGIGQEWTRYQKIEGLKETITATEAVKNHALQEYESIKVNCQKLCSNIVPLRKLIEHEVILKKHL